MVQLLPHTENGIDVETGTYAGVFVGQPVRDGETDHKGDQEWLDWHMVEDNEVEQVKAETLLWQPRDTVRM